MANCSRPPAAVHRSESENKHSEKSCRLTLRNLAAILLLPPNITEKTDPPIFRFKILVFGAYVLINGPWKFLYFCNTNIGLFNGTYSSSLSHVLGQSFCNGLIKRLHISSSGWTDKTHIPHAIRVTLCGFLSVIINILTWDAQHQCSGITCVEDISRIIWDWLHQPPGALSHVNCSLSGFASPQFNLNRGWW